MKKGYTFILLTAFLYSTQEIAGKLLASENKLDPYQVTFIVFLIGAFGLLPAALKDLKKRNLKLGLNDFLYFLLTGTLCIPLAMSAIQVAVGYTKASTVAVLFSTVSIATMPFAYIILKEEINKVAVISMILCLSGVAFIFNPAELIAGLGNVNNITGILTAVFGAITYALFTVFTTKRVKKYGGYVFNCFSFLIGDLVLLVGLLVTNRPILQGITPDNLLLLLYVGIFIKGLGYVFYLGAMRETSAVIASTVFLIKPALAPILALIILHESINSNVIAGMVFIIIGSYINLRYKCISNKNGEANKLNLNNEGKVI